MIQKKGEGTSLLSNLEQGDKITTWGPLGNGFLEEEPVPYRKIALIGGGIGVAPLLPLLQQLKKQGS